MQPGWKWAFKLQGRVGRPGRGQKTSPRNLRLASAPQSKVMFGKLLKSAVPVIPARGGDSLIIQ